MPHPTTPPAYDATPSSSAPSSSTSSPAFNAFALPDVDPLPSYSRNYRRGEFSFPEPTDYIYTTKNTMLNLGKRINSTTIPSYGKNGLIQGMLTVTNFEHVKEISVTISGVASILVTDEGLGATAHREERVVLRHKIVLWSYSSRKPTPVTTQHYPISYTLPTFSALKDGSHLPPSRAASSQTVALEVKYSVKVDVSRFGLYWHESNSIPFLYLPRSVPRPPEYYAAHKTDPRDVQEWGTYDAHPLSEHREDDTIVKLHLPLPLSYPSGLPIPFRASLSSSSSPALNSHIVQTKMSVQLVKLIYVHVGSTRIPLDRILQTGHKWRVIHSGEKDGEWEISGSIDGVRPGSETAWTLNRFIEVKYAVRLSVERIHGVIPGFVAEVPVELVTDPPEDLLRDKDACEYPALGLIQQQQHLSTD